MFSWFRTKPSPREMWLQIYARHVGMGINHLDAMAYATEAVRAANNQV